MSRTTIDHVARAVLYEGYNLYPYRRSVKSERRWTFGVVSPRQLSEQSGEDSDSSMRTECLIEGDAVAQVNIELRFLHLTARRVARLAYGADPRSESDWTFVDTLEVDQMLYQSWQEASEQTVSCGAHSLAELCERTLDTTFQFPASQEVQILESQTAGPVGVVVHEREPITGLIECAAVQLAADLYRLTVRIVNTSRPVNDSAVRRGEPLQSLVSTHVRLETRGGEFVSVIDPPDELRETSGQLANDRLWPVLVGEPGQRNVLLCSSIILYDYPEIAAESPGDLFDSTEIDEILALRIMTLTDEEKRQMKGMDERTQEILQRTEALPQEQMMKLHGAIRGLRRVTDAHAEPASTSNDR